MITINRQTSGMYGVGGLGQTRMPAYPSAAAKLMAAQQGAGAWMQVQQLNGLGEIVPGVPDPVIWGAGGLLVGLGLGYALYGMKKKGRR